MSPPTKVAVGRDLFAIRQTFLQSQYMSDSTLSDENRTDCEKAQLILGLPSLMPRSSTSLPGFMGS
jgi:hypothetical protein